MSFTFVVKKPGNHTFCMIAYDALNVSVTIKKGASAHDFDEIANKKDIFSVHIFN
jgi:hypothetical protein